MLKDKKRNKERLHSIKQSKKQKTSAALKEDNNKLKGYKILSVVFGIFFSYTISTLGLKFIMDLRSIWVSWGILSFIILIGTLVVYIFALIFLSKFFISKLEPISYNFFKKIHLRKIKKQEKKYRKERRKLLKKLGIKKC